MLDNFAAKVTFFVCAAVFSLLHIVFCFVFLAVKPYKAKKRDVVLTCVTAVTLAVDILLIVLTVLLNFSADGFHLTVDGAFRTGQTVHFTLGFLAPLLGTLILPESAGVLAGLALVASVCALLHARRAVNKNKLLRKALVPVSGGASDEQIDIDFKDDNATDEFVDNLSDDNIDKHIEFLIEKAKDGLPERSSALFDELVKIVDGLPEDDNKADDDGEQAEQEPQTEQEPEDNEDGEQAEQQPQAEREPEDNEGGEPEQERKAEQEPKDNEDGEQAEQEPQAEQQPEDNEDGQQAEQEPQAEREPEDNDDGEQAEQQPQTEQKQAEQQKPQSEKRGGYAAAEAFSEYPNLKVRTIVMPRYFENRVQNVVAEPMEVVVKKSGATVDVAHEEIKPKGGGKKKKASPAKPAEKSEPEKELPPLKQAEKAGELYTKKYIVLNRQNAANAFSEYLKQKQRESKDIDNVNTIFLK